MRDTAINRARRPLFLTRRRLLLQRLGRNRRMNLLHLWNRPNQGVTTRQMLTITVEWSLEVWVSTSCLKRLINNG